MQEMFLDLTKPVLSYKILLLSMLTVVICLQFHASQLSSKKKSTPLPTPRSLGVTRNVTLQQHCLKMERCLIIKKTYCRKITKNWVFKSHPKCLVCHEATSWRKRSIFQKIFVKICTMNLLTCSRNTYLPLSRLCGFKFVLVILLFVFQQLAEIDEMRKQPSLIRQICVSWRGNLSLENQSRGAFSAIPSSLRL